MSHPYVKTVPAWRDVTRLIVAAIVAAGFHFLLWFLFTTQAESSTSKNHVLRGVTMVALDDPMDLGAKRLLAWMTYRNPTLIAKPSERHGYSSLFRKPEFIPPANDIFDHESAAAETLIDRRDFEFRPLDEFFENRENSIRDYPPLPPPPLGPTAPPEAESYPRWRNGPGALSPQLFGNADEVRTLIAKRQPTAATVIRLSWIGNEFLPGTKVTQSCGSAELDALAVKSLLANLAKATLNRRRGDVVSVAVDWTSPKVAVGTGDGPGGGR